jgi:hypothetical protein
MGGNIKIDLRKVRFEGGWWLELGQDRVQCWTSILAVLDFDINSVGLRY